ncbi:MAG: AIR synthase [Enterocloster sp.]
MLEARFHGVFLDRLKTAAERSLDLPQNFEDPGVTEWEYVRGRHSAALWNISGAYEQGISFSLLKIPVSQEIIEVCELFDLNPYRLRSGHCMLMVSDHGWDLAERLREMGAEAAVIGKVERGIARKMTGLGSTGFLERPQPDEVLKLG